MEVQRGMLSGVSALPIVLGGGGSQVITTQNEKATNTASEISQRGFCFYLFISFFFNQIKNQITLTTENFIQRERRNKGVRSLITGLRVWFI